jgi:hypothetical protein
MYFNYFLKGRVFLKIFLYTRLEGVIDKENENEMKMIFPSKHKDENLNWKFEST